MHLCSYYIYNSNSNTRALREWKAEIDQAPHSIKKADSFVVFPMY